MKFSAEESGSGEGKVEAGLKFLVTEASGFYRIGKIGEENPFCWFAAQRARLDLLEKYHGKIEESLSSVQAGQFLQIENQIGIFIDLTIASEMPMVGKQIK